MAISLDEISKVVQDVYIPVVMEQIKVESFMYSYFRGNPFDSFLNLNCRGFEEVDYLLFKDPHRCISNVLIWGIREKDGLRFEVNFSFTALEAHSGAVNHLLSTALTNLSTYASCGCKEWKDETLSVLCPCPLHGGGKEDA